MINQHSGCMGTRIMIPGEKRWPQSRPPRLDVNARSQHSQLSSHIILLLICRVGLSDTRQSDAFGSLCAGLTVGNPELNLRCKAAEMWGILETVQTAFHCAAVPEDTVLFLAVLLIISLSLFPSTRFIYLLLFFSFLVDCFCLFVSPPSPASFQALLSFLDSKEKGIWVMASKTSQGRNA